MTSSFTTVEVDVGGLPFEVEVRSHASLDAGVFADGAAIALVAIGRPYRRLPEIGRVAGVPVVPVAEYTLHTQQRIMELSTPSVLRRIRRRRWLAAEYRGVERLIRSAAGLQCNGTPTFGPCDRCCFLFWREEWLERVTG